MSTNYKELARRAYPMDDDAPDFSAIDKRNAFVLACEQVADPLRIERDKWRTKCIINAFDKVFDEPAFVDEEGNAVPQADIDVPPARSGDLNPLRLAARRYPGLSDDGDKLARAKGYAAAIREVAQHIADERDEYREALEAVCDGVERASSDNVAGANMRLTVKSLRAILAKYPKNT
jgi:hypothetical protein